MTTTRSVATKLCQTLLAFILALGLAPALPHQAQAEEYSTLAGGNNEFCIQGSNVTVDVYKYQNETGEYEQIIKDSKPSIYIRPELNSKYRIEYNIPENTKPKLETLGTIDGITCTPVEGKEFAWEFTTSNTDSSSYTRLDIRVCAYTSAVINCEETTNGSLSYEITEGDLYEGTATITLTPNSGYTVEKVEYNKQTSSISDSYWYNLSQLEKQENGTYTTKLTLQKSTASPVYTLRASFAKTEKLEITNEDELFAFANRVNARESFAGSTITLKSDITLTRTWTTMSGATFRGTFNGDGHTISALDVQGFYQGDYSSSGGFFYGVENATIKNLTLEGTITPASTDTSYGIGAFSCYAANSNFVNCTSKVNISFAKGSVIGGIVGSANSQTSFTNCINEGFIVCSDAGGAIGGIAGQTGIGSSVTFTQCANYGDISATNDPSSGNASNCSLGGIVGRARSGAFERCVNKGNIAANPRAAGICGELASDACEELLFTNCYNTGTISAYSSKTKKDGSPVAAGICATEASKTLETLYEPIKASFTNCYNTGTIKRTGSIVEDYPDICEGQIAPNPLLVGNNHDSFRDYDMEANGNWTLDNCYGKSDTFDANSLGSAYRDETAGVTGGSPLLTWEPESATNSKEPVPATSITLSNTSLTLEQYDAATLSAAVEPASTTDTLEWSTSNDAVATVTERGVVSAVSAGTCTITATAGSVSATCEVSVTTYDGTLLHGGETISRGGSYKLASDAKGTVTIDTENAVTIRGMGADKNRKYQNNIYFDCTRQPSKLTLCDMYLSNTGNTNLVNFARQGNELCIEGTCVLDYSPSTYSGAGHEALIHVPQNASLTVKGSGTLYAYKSSAGAIFGGDHGELNGNITFALTGSMFAKGTKQGAVIGSGAESASVESAPGSITFESGTYNLISNSRGAVIGGAAGSNGASSGTKVYVHGGSININCDWSGSAVGGGGYDSGNDSSGGTLYITGGSFRTYVDKNVATNLGDSSYYKGLPLTEGINNTLVTAERKNETGEDVFLCVVDTQGIEPAADGTYTVTVDGKPFFSGKLHEYAFLNETVDRGDGSVDTSVDYTPENWVANEDSCLYLYLTGTAHDIEVNGQTIEVVYRASSLGTAAETNGGSFSVPYTLGDVNNNGSLNIVDAQIVYDLVAGVYANEQGDYATFPLPKGWNLATLFLAADANESGTLEAADAFAIQYAALHGGVFGGKE